VFLGDVITNPDAPTFFSPPIAGRQEQTRVNRSTATGFTPRPVFIHFELGALGMDVGVFLSWITPVTIAKIRLHV
jgi:hypothetical protein